ncbi:hypothetical protein [Bradyrhizobium sp.]|jgi:hypothetical protein|uniref:hypothetical protein n=1 Tax=Bradyrhizobium sp. TaxID=376 RepID=UPI002D6F7A55|nr:hypothetical protein [Bradyrhizobium sp.]HZR71883.1 hypothetical protein [Bradyrhizobium sp.]
MRREQQSLLPARKAAEFKIHFQMTNAGARHACSVTILATSRIDADAIFRDNWITIEKLTRLNLVAEQPPRIRLETALENQERAA